MARRRITAALIATAATAALVAVPLATPAAAAPSGKLTIWGTQNQSDRLDLGATGTSVGDVVTGSGALALTKGGKAVGSFAYRAETVRVNIPGGAINNLTTQSYTLPKGTILTQSLVKTNAGTPPTANQALVILGGTGAYAGANGTAVLDPAKSGTPWKVVFTFTN